MLTNNRLKLQNQKKQLEILLKKHGYTQDIRPDHTTGRDKNLRFDRRLEIYLDLKPNTVDIQKIASFLKLLDKLGSKIK